MHLEGSKNSRCVLCGEDNCSSDECRRHRMDAENELNRQHVDSVKRLSVAALFQRSPILANPFLSRLSRWFYTAKALTCVLLCRKRYHGPFTPRVVVASVPSPDCLESLLVRRGVLTGWFYWVEYCA